jgi:DnaJ-class molecular chaperone
MPRSHPPLSKAAAYAALDLDPGASPEDIRRAYRRAALQCHPDKDPRPEARARFDAVSAAYRVLTGPHDAAHDAQDTDDAAQNTALWAKTQAALDDLAAAWLAWLLTELQRARQTPAPPVRLTLRVTLEDLFRKAVKKVTVKVQRWDPAAGACRLRSETLYLSLLNAQPTYVLPNAGDDAPLAEGDPACRGPLEIAVAVAKHPVYRASGIFSPYDLTAIVELTLLQYYYGDPDLTLPYLDGTDLPIPFSPHRDDRTGSDASYQKRPGHGLPYWDADAQEERRGDLYVAFEPVLPPPDGPLPETPGFREALALFYSTRTARKDEPDTCVPTA